MRIFPLAYQDELYGAQDFNIVLFYVNAFRSFAYKACVCWALDTKYAKDHLILLNLSTKCALERIWCNILVNKYICS